MASGYDSPRFWHAFNKFFFACDTAQAGLENLTNALVSQGLKSDNPINVLCLGIGAAGFEFPLLAALKRVSQRPVNVVGIDKSAKVLNVASHLCSQLDHQFSSSLEFADLVKENWETHNHQRNFLELDLDGRDDRLIEDRPWTGDHPSDWHLTLQERHLIPEGGFDVVVAAFCFHHVHWWRSTLCNALTLLRPGGHFLLSQVDGDVSYLDWNQPEQWLLREREAQKKPELIRPMMEKFWSHDLLQRFLLKRPQAGAVRPWDTTDLLDRLPLTRVIESDDTAYYSRNQYQPSDLAEIMGTRGLSPFRRAKEILDKAGNSAYKEWVTECLDSFNNLEPCSTANRIRWHAYTINDRDSLISNSIFRKFVPTSEDGGIKQDKIRHPYELWEYEMTEASAVAHKSFLDSDLDGASFEYFLKELILGGSLNQKTPFGVMGQRLIRQEKFTQSSICFANPLGNPNKMSELMLYMCLRQSHLSHYSNSNTLLKDILPKFNVPVIFSYIRKPLPETEEPSIELSHQRYRSFLEIRFEIKLPAEFKDKVLEGDSAKRAFQIVNDSLIRGFAELSNGQDGSENNNRPCFILPVSHIKEGQEQNLFKDCTLALSKSFHNDWGLEHARTKLKNSRCSVPRLRDALSEDLCDDMAESIYWLSLISQWEQVVIYPAAYSAPEGGSVCADDSLILFYTEILDDSSLRHEFRKVALMLDQLNMRRLATLGESAGLIDFNKAMSHELAKQTNVLFSRRLLPMSSLFEIPEYERTKADDRKWSSPVGNIQNIGEGTGSHMPEMADWLVCPTPRLFDALRSYLFLWAGATNMLEALVGHRSIQSFAEFLEVAIQIARSGSVSQSFQEEVTSLSDVKNADIDFESALKKLPDIQSQESSIPKINLIWINPKQSNARLESVLIICLRALVAGFHNAIQHTPKQSQQIIQYSVEQRTDGILVTIRNPIQHRDGQTITITQDGTWGVIRNCLRLLDKDSTYPQCSPKDEHWVTQLLLPNPAKLKGEDSVHWLEYLS